MFILVGLWLRCCSVVNHVLLSWLHARGACGMRTIGGPGLKRFMVIGAAEVHLLITGLALGHCGITKFVASCKLGAAVLTGLRQQEEEDEEKVRMSSERPIGDPLLGLVS